MATDTASPAPALTLRQFWNGLVTVPDPTTGALVVARPHQAQDEIIDALDLRDPVTGLRAYPIVFLDWARKCAKDFTFMVYVLYHLGFDPFEKEPRYAAIAAWDAEQTQISRRTGEQLIERHPWLRAHYRVQRNSIVFTEEVREPRTGGVYTVEHLAEFLSRDTKGSHGLNISLKIHNEFWADADYGFEEALVVSPSRRSPLTIYASYHGLRQDERPGIPLHDLRERVKAGDPRIFHSFVGGEGDRAPELLVPWRTPQWKADQQALFAHAPNRYRRMILNLPAGPDAGLVSFSELEDARMALDEPAGPEPGCTYFLCGDLGAVNDWTVLLGGHLDARNRLVIDLERHWRGSHAAPVSFTEVGETIVELHRRFRFEQVVIDAWQAHLLVEQLQRQRVPASIITLDGGKLDRMVTQLKAAFTRRAVLIPERLSDLREQLESLQAVEAGRRRDLLKFQPGVTTGNTAQSHDDLAVTLAMLLDLAWPTLGRVALPMAMTECYRETSIPSFSSLSCFLVGTDGNFIPPGNSDASCAACPGWQWARQAYKEYSEREGSERLDLRTWRRRFVADNEYVGRARQRVWQDWYF